MGPRYKSCHLLSLPIFSLRASCLLLLTTRVFAGETDVRTAMKATLPTYDPAVRQKLYAVQEDARAKSDDSGTVPPQTGQTTEPGDNVADKVVKLSPITVYADRLKPAVPALPRPTVEAPESSMRIDPFLTQKGRDLALAKKYLTVLDRCVLNRWTIPLVGQSKETRARKADKTYQAAVAQGQLADAVDLLGQMDPESQEYKELKEIYQQIEYSRPRE
jgi:hypothetical protein